MWGQAGWLRQSEPGPSQGSCQGGCQAEHKGDSIPALHGPLLVSPTDRSQPEAKGPGMLMKASSWATEQGKG